MIVGIVAVSAAASALICYLVYFHAPVDVAGTHFRSLPSLNAVLNTLSASALIQAYIEVRKRRFGLHRIFMFAAFFFSTIFLVSYLLNYTMHGESHFNRLSAWWPFYWKLLATHILCSILALPLILITFFLSLTGRFPAHKRLARYTFPLWLYVSVTGVIVYLMQASIH